MKRIIETVEGVVLIYLCLIPRNFLLPFPMLLCPVPVRLASASLS